MTDRGRSYLSLFVVPKVVIKKDYVVDAYTVLQMGYLFVCVWIKVVILSVIIK